MMGKHWKLFYILLFPILLSPHLYGQTQTIEFDHLSTNDGLSNGYIKTIFQDSRGFIWIGTFNGLNRFDGISFRTYFFDPKDTTSVSGHSISSFSEDAGGNIWVMTNVGICVYDREKDDFQRKRLVVNNQKKDALDITSSFIDSKGMFWVGTYDGIYRFKIMDNPIASGSNIDAEKYSLDELDLSTVNLNTVFSFVEGRDGKIWTASYSKNLFYFDENLKKFISYEVDIPQLAEISNKQKGMIMDRDGDFLIAVEHAGLLVWDRKKDHFTLYYPSGSKIRSENEILYALAEDKDGLIWIGDRNNEGIYLFDKTARTFQNLKSDELNPYSLHSNQINYIYRDKTSTMWVGSIVGINKYNPDKIKFRRYFSNSKSADNQPSSNNILCFNESKDGSVWIGTDGGGLNKLDRRTGILTHYKHDPDNPNSISSNAIVSLCEDGEGAVWIGTFNGGLGKFYNNKFSAYYPDPANPFAIAQKHIWSVFEDSKNNMWVGTLSYGLELFDRKTGRFYLYSSSNSDSTSLCNNSMVQLFEDSEHRLFILTSKGISTIDLKAVDFSRMPPAIKFENLYHHEIKNSLSSNSVYCVAEDNEKNLWFGNMATGLDKFDRKTGKYTNYSTKDGLPGNSIKSILFDDNNDLWVSTDKGLARFNPKTNEVHVFDNFDGLQNKSFNGNALKTRDGEMFFGGASGFNSFFPEKIKYNKNLPKVVITGLKIFNQSVEVGEKVNGRVVLDGDIVEANELALDYLQNFFTLEFITLDYTTPEKNRYAYMLEGFDKDWVESGTKREANYTDIDPGEYTFKVKATNSDGIWNEVPTKLKIIILPPWWATWWFRLIIVSSIIFVGSYFYYSRFQYFKEQKILLEKLIAEKTSELQKTNNTLLLQAEELNQINLMLEERQEQIEEQSEELLAQKESLIKMNSELNEANATKDKFFSIIAHDIKNPFNAVLGFTDLLEENFNEWDDGRKLEIVNLINSSAKNLYQLLENLLMWARSQSGAIKFKPQHIDLKDKFINTIQLFRETAGAKNIKLEILSPQASLFVYADINMLDTILRNLISNAIKFTDQGGKIQLTAEAVDNFVMIKVKDNGVGISEEIQSQLFQIDKQTTTVGTNNEQGTGLGLILVKEFVSKQGGEIGVESIRGEGTTFYFTLPLA